MKIEELDAVVIRELVERLVLLQEGFERDGYPGAADLMFDLIHRCEGYLRNEAE